MIDATRIVRGRQFGKTAFPALLAVLLLQAPAAAQAGQAPGPAPSDKTACLQRLQAMEAQGKLEIGRLTGAIEAAADAGDGATLCAASGRLLSVYEGLRQAAAACSAERAAVWAGAERASLAALHGICR